jgi:hypothetical protein
MHLRHTAIASTFHDFDLHPSSSSTACMSEVEFTISIAYILAHCLRFQQVTQRKTIDKIVVGEEATVVSNVTYSDQKQQIRSIIILCQFHFQLTLYCKQCEHYTPSKNSHKLWQIIVCYPWKTTKPSWRQKSREGLGRRVVVLECRT